MEAKTRWLEMDGVADMLATIDRDPRFAAVIDATVLSRYRQWARGRSDVEVALIGGEVLAIASLALARKIAGEWPASRGGVTKADIEALAQRLASRIEAVAREAIEPGG